MAKQEYSKIFAAESIGKRTYGVSPIDFRGEILASGIFICI